MIFIDIAPLSMRKNLITFLSISSILLIPSIAYAQTQPAVNTPVTKADKTAITPALTVVSDYALDVQQGKQSVNNDSEAQNNQKEVANNETIEAHEGTEAVEPVEKVEPQEAVEPKEAENETVGEKRTDEINSKGPDSSTESNKQSDGENKNVDNENSKKM